MNLPPPHIFIKPGVYRPLLEIAFVREVGMHVCVCVSAPEVMNNQWHDLWRDMKPK